jgi:hypothetical protein
MAYAFGVAIDKDVMRRILGISDRPRDLRGRPWLTLIGDMKDSL